MANKKTKLTQQRTREEQWKRRVGGPAQTRPAAGVGPAGTLPADDIVGSEDEPSYTQAEMRTMARPAATSTGSAAVAATQAPRAARPAGAAVGTMPSTAAATQRRAAATASRVPRGRLQPQTMSLDEEMYYVRADIRSLIILSAVCIAVIIVLAFVIR